MSPCHFLLLFYPPSLRRPAPVRSFISPFVPGVGMQPLLNIAVRAARRAGEIIVRSMNRVHQLDVRAKGRNDYVTEVDTAVERDIVETIRKSYPDHAILAEESGASGDNEFVWIIDPL